jgi:hypothetical protein
MQNIVDLNTRTCAQTFSPLERLSRPRCTKTSDGKQVTGWPRVAFSLRQRAVGREAQQSGNSNKFPGLASQSAQVRTRPMRVSTRAEDLECKIFGMCEWQIQNVLYSDGLDQNLLGSTVLNAKSLESGQQRKAAILLVSCDRKPFHNEEVVKRKRNKIVVLSFQKLQTKMACSKSVYLYCVLKLSLGHLHRRRATI